eukprot:IDg15120t1
MVCRVVGKLAICDRGRYSSEHEVYDRPYGRNVKEPLVRAHSHGGGGWMDCAIVRAGGLQADSAAAGACSECERWVRKRLQDAGRRTERERRCEFSTQQHRWRHLSNCNATAWRLQFLRYLVEPGCNELLYILATDWCLSPWMKHLSIAVCCIIHACLAGALRHGQ